MFERFSERARQVMALANPEAQRFGREYASPEHVLLAILREGNGVAATVLRILNLDLRAARRQVEHMVREQTAANAAHPDGHIAAETTHQLVEQAIEEARRADHHLVGTEHLLLALMRDSDGLPARILSGLGVQPEAVRAEIRKIFDTE